jgi:sulfotransferase family protein
MPPPGLYRGRDEPMKKTGLCSVRSVLTRVLRKLNHHRTTELYFVGHPKTGNTWLRYMLGRYVQLTCGLRDLPLFDATDLMGRCEGFCVGPAMQFTHRPLLWHDQRAADLDFENVIRPFQHKRVVLLIRHPLDTLVSHWMQRKHQIREDYAGSLSEFLEDPVWGIEKFFRFYSLWFQHRERVRNLLLMRYEDIRTDPHSAFGRLLEYLDIPRQDDRVQQAVGDSDFENMKKIELAGAGPKYRSSGFNIFGTSDMNNPESFHVRRGKVGGFHDYLEEKDVNRLIDRINRQLPDFFGYSIHLRQVG